MQHDVNIGAAVAHIDDVVRPDLATALQLVQHRYLAITCGGLFEALHVAGTGVGETRPKNILFGHDAFERRLNHLDRRGGQDIEIEVVAIDSAIENLVEQIDLLFQSHPFAGLIEVLAANFAVKFRIVQQQIR